MALEAGIDLKAASSFILPESHSNGRIEGLSPAEPRAARPPEQEAETTSPLIAIPFQSGRMKVSIV